MLRKLLSSLALCAVTPFLLAQATPTASRRGEAILGAGFTTAASDYGKRFTGLNLFGDFDFTRHLGVEANLHYVSSVGGSTLYERTYEGGGRYYTRLGPFVPFAKVMLGRGIFNFPPNPPPATQNVARANLAYTMFALGGGTDFPMNSWLYLRVDYEYQRWLSFPDKNGSGLTPQLLSFGAAYRF